jgi:hypothetical protein
VKLRVSPEGKAHRDGVSQRSVEENTGCKKDKVKGRWRNKHNAEHLNLCFSQIVNINADVKLALCLIERIFKHCSVREVDGSELLSFTPLSLNPEKRVPGTHYIGE